MISILDCGMGNLGSIRNMLKHIGVENRIVSNLQDIRQSNKFILPGVGNWNFGAAQLDRDGFREVLGEKVLDQKKPVLGICLGMQLLADSSEEGCLPGLGWIPGEVKRFPDQCNGEKLRVPHMGWNIARTVGSTALTKGLESEARFYFVHSYYFECRNPEDRLMQSKYGIEFTSAVRRENVWGVQFHPEKSHRFGMALLKNFADL